MIVLRIFKKFWKGFSSELSWVGTALRYHVWMEELAEMVGRVLAFLVIGLMAVTVLFFMMRVIP